MSPRYVYTTILCVALAWGLALALTIVCHTHP